MVVTSLSAFLKRDAPDASFSAPILLLGLSCLYITP